MLTLLAYTEHAMMMYGCFFIRSTKYNINKTLLSLSRAVSTVMRSTEKGFYFFAFVGTLGGTRHVRAVPNDTIFRARTQKPY